MPRIAASLWGRGDIGRWLSEHHSRPDTTSLSVEIQRTATSKQSQAPAGPTSIYKSTPEVASTIPSVAPCV